MDTFGLIAETAFWLSCLVLAYVYAGFPVALLLTKPRWPSASPVDLAKEDLPSVCLLTAAWNEEAVIEEKLRNCLELDYPKDRLTFLFVSDGSTDRTNEILRRYEGPRIRILLLPQRGGKIRALKKAFPLCESEILVLSDANAFYRSDAVRKLVRHFGDPSVGVVTGDVRLRPSPKAFGKGEGFFYRYERWLQNLESRYESVVGVDGAMYALRRHLLHPPSDNVILDDFVISMNVARQGFRIVYEPAAIAEEDPTPEDGAEFRRKVRVVAGGFQALFQGEGLPRWGQRRLLWLYVSHKLLRWLAPLFLCVAFITSAAMAITSSSGKLLLLAQLVFYGLAAVGRSSERLSSSFFRIPYYFGMVNLAAFLGLFRALRGTETVLWSRAARMSASS